MTRSNVLGWLALALTGFAWLFVLIPIMMVLWTVAQG